MVAHVVFSAPLRFEVWMWVHAVYKPMMMPVNNSNWAPASNFSKVRNAHGVEVRFRCRVEWNSVPKTGMVTHRLRARFQRG